MEKKEVDIGKLFGLTNSEVLKAQNEFGVIVRNSLIKDDFVKIAKALGIAKKGKTALQAYAFGRLIQMLQVATLSNDSELEEFRTYVG